MGELVTLEDDVSWNREPMLFYVGRHGMADRSRSGTVLLNVPPGVPDGEYFLKSFQQHLAGRTVPQALSLLKHLRAIWSHHWTNQISLNLVQGDEVSVNFLRTDRGGAAFRAGDVEFELPVKPTRLEAAGTGAPKVNNIEAMLMAAIRLTVARAYRLGQLGDGEFGRQAEAAEQQLQKSLEQLLRPIGRQFGLNAHHYRKAKPDEPPTFGASENGAEKAIELLFPGETGSAVLQELERTGRRLRAADRQRLLVDELAQLRALIFIRRAARLQEQAARAVIQSQKKARAKREVDGDDPHEPRITTPTLKRIGNIAMLLEAGMPSTILLVRAALTTGVVTPINAFLNRGYLLPLLYAARFIGQVTINQGVGVIPGALTAGGLAAIAVNWQDPDADRSNPDISASLYVARVLADAGIHPSELYQLASQCLVDREATNLRLRIRQPRFLPPPLPT